MARLPGLVKSEVKEVSGMEIGAARAGRERWKQRLAGAGQGFSFCRGSAVLFIGGGGGRPLQTERSKEGEQPLSLLWVYSQWAGFVLAGWLPLRKAGQAIEPRVKAGA